jgi:hypothetical protein
MPAAELHFYDADDLNGSILFQCTTDDEFVKSIELDIQRDSLGSGRVTFARKVGTALFTRQIVVPEVLVRVLIPSIHATRYIGGFFINPRQQQVVSEAEDGGDGFTFAGPGPKHYLERMILWSSSFLGGNNNVDREAGLWVWPETASAGRILNRLFSEDANNPDGPFLPALTNDFTATDDSNNDPWTEDVASGADDFRLRIGDDYLKILWTLEDIASLTTLIDLGEVGDPQMLLRAFETYGRDLTGPLGADTVHWIEGVNIRADLDVEGSSYRKASHALVRGNDGIYELAVRDAWSPGELKKAVATAYESSSPTILDRAGRRFLRNQTFGEQQIDLNIITGWDPVNGLYMPGPDGTDGHFWVGDTIDLTTGMDNSTILDYQSEAQAVTGIQLELEEAVRDDTDLQAARSFAVTVSLNEERKSSRTSEDLAGNRGTVSAPPNVLKLCQPRLVTELEPVALVGAACSASGDNFDSEYPPWSGDKEEYVEITVTDAVPEGHSLVAVVGVQQTGCDALPDTVYDQQGNAWTKDAEYENTGSSSDDTIQIWHCNVGDPLLPGDYIRWAVNVGGSLDPGAESNGRCFGVYQFSTFLTVDTVGTGAGTFNNSVSISTPAGDLVIAGVSAFLISGGDADWEELIPQTEISGSGANQSSVFAEYLLPGGATTWTPTCSGNNDWAAIAVSYSAAASGSGGANDGNADLVGTSPRAARCDHRHDVHRDTAPTVDDDFATAGYKLGTIWAQLDDLGTPTEIVALFLAVDVSTGAAVWLEFPGGSAGITVEDEGSVEGTGIDTLNFTGSGVSVTVTGSEAEVIVSGGGGGGTVRACSVYRNAALNSSSSAGGAAIAYDTEERDDGGFWASGNPTRFTIPADGWYVMGAHTQLTTSQDSQFIFIKKTAAAGGGAVIMRQNRMYETTNGIGLHCEITSQLYLLTGDYIEFWFENGAAQAFDVGSPQLLNAWIHQVGGA